MRSGVYKRVKRRHLLGDPGRKKGALVLILACGHARTVNKGAVGTKAWCRICTANQELVEAKARRQEKITMTRAQFEAAVKVAARKLSQNVRILHRVLNKPT